MQSNDIAKSARMYKLHKDIRNNNLKDCRDENNIKY